MVTPQPAPLPEQEPTKVGDILEQNPDLTGDLSDAERQLAVRRHDLEDELAATEAVRGEIRQEVKAGREIDPDRAYESGLNHVGAKADIHDLKKH